MRKYNNSLIARITIGTVVLLVLSLVVLVTNYLYSIYVVKSNIIGSKSNTLNIYINNMDNILSNAESDLDAIITNIEDFSDLSSDDEATRYFLSIKSLDVITNRINSNKNSDALIVYNEESDTYLAAYSNQISTNNKWDLIQLAKLDEVKNQTRDRLWSIGRINGSVYFYKTYALTSTRIITVVTPKKLMSLVDTTMSDSEIFVLTDQLGQKITSDGSKDHNDIETIIPNDSQVVKNYKEKYMIVSSELQKAEARLSILLKNTNIFLGLSFIQWVIILLGGLFLVIMPFMINYLNKEIIKPINRLITGIGEVEKGNLEYHVEIHENSKEFIRLINMFNSMVKEIKNLKISYYEEKIELQKAELKYLQYQLRPHFFLNAITTIHSLTYKDQKEDIRAYIDALVMHFRYVLKGAMTQVTVDDEIAHVKNYIAMQEIRFPGSVFYVVDLDQNIKVAYVPQLIMLTIVENAFKHAMTLDETLSVFIKVEKVIWNGEETVEIIIEDNGEGFPKEVIEKINHDCVEETQDGSKIGLSNIKKTLKLLYGNKGNLLISNAEPCGAKIHIRLPIEVNKNEINNN